MEKTNDYEVRSNMYLLYLFALVAHVIMFVFFSFYEIKIMAIFNAFSIFLYIMLVLLYKQRNKYTLMISAVILSTIEVILHQLLAIICLGTEPGFQLFLIMIMIVIILQVKEIINRQHKIFLSFMISACMIGAQIYATYHEPIYELPNVIRQIMLATVTGVALFGIIAFSYNQWSISEHYLTKIEELLGERNSKIFTMQEKIIRNFGDIIEDRDGNTGGHIKRTSAYVEAIINALNESHVYSEILTPEYAKMVISAAPLHDIGKISISDSILCKKGKLTPEEYEDMKKHSSLGGEMLEELLGDLESEEYVSLARDISKYHHEKWNGEGYPERLRGEEIPLCARIMAVADVFDALTSERVYKDKFPLNKAFQIMESESGQQFDPTIIREFLKIKSTITEIYERQYE